MVNRHKKIRLGTIHADCLTFDDALASIEACIRDNVGGYVVTPNVDHVCMAETDERLQQVYRDSSLSLVDGMPLLWLGKLMGQPFPEKISGSDLIRPLMQRAAKRGWRVYFLGGMPGVAESAAKILAKEYSGLQIAGTDAPPLGFEKNPKQSALVLEKIRLSQPHLILVALGAPKQEYWMAENRKAFSPAVALGIGASLDFIAGVVKRSPSWMSQFGLEWLYRLFQEPKRMASRYLVRDRAIVGIAIRMLRSPKENRVLPG